MKLILALTGCLAMVGCQTATAITSSPDACLIWSPVTYSAKGDTAQTVNEVRALNAKRDAYCSRKP